MRLLTSLLLTILSFGLAPVYAHDVPTPTRVVIDTDLGLDDAVTLALALQAPDIEVISIVVTDGASSASAALERLEALLTRFNRRDIALYGPATEPGTGVSPPFREFAENAVAQALPSDAPALRRTFTPAAYVPDEQPVTVLALGPLTNLAAALRARPDLAGRIEAVVMPGSPHPETNWNLRYDRTAFLYVSELDIARRFVPPGPALRKPPGWTADSLALGCDTSLAAGFLTDLFDDQRVRKHYVEQFEQFYDEAALLYVIAPDLFSDPAATGVVQATDGPELLALVERLLCEGRQYRTPILLRAPDLPAGVLRDHAGGRKARLIAKHGQTEWFVQLLMNEFHGHLGAYSIVGAKMGLRAAERLNAPPNAIRIETHVPFEPPVGCLNDGLIVATGSTPGRGLITYADTDDDRVAATFTYADRTLTLTLKPEYHQRMRGEIAVLRQRHGLADSAYWHGVELFGLRIWENWHRTRIFTVADGAAKPDEPKTGEAAEKAAHPH